MLLSLMGLPPAAAIAILRYRLYDIDVVINRALVYGALTATLAATYLGSISAPVALNCSPGPDWPSPSRRLQSPRCSGRRHRIQEAVDRRFFRRRYDAEHTFEAFSARLRDEVDLGTVNTELSRSVVRETLQPAHVSLWLRSPGGGP